MCAHKVGKIHPGIRLSYEQRASLVQPDDRFAGKGIECHKTATILISRHGIVVELSIDIIHVQIHAEHV